MADDTPKGDAEKIAKYLAERGATKLGYMTILPVEPTMRFSLTWGKGKKMVRPIKRRVKL